MKRRLIISLIVFPLIVGSNMEAVNGFSLNNTSTIERTLLTKQAEVKETKVIEYKSMVSRFEEVIAKQREVYLAEQAELERIRLEEEKRIEEQRLLEEENIRKDNVNFNPYDVTQPSNIKDYELANVLYNTINGQGLIDYASYFVEAEEIYGINAFFICAIAAQESGWGASAAGNGTNITGYAVYTSTSEGFTFGNIRENILKTAELLSYDYTSPTGKYRTVWEGYGDGKSIWEINQRYCLYEDQITPDNNWSANLNSIANDFVQTFHSLVKVLE